VQKKPRRNRRTTTIAPPKVRADKPSLETIIEAAQTETITGDGKNNPTCHDGVSSPTHFEGANFGNTDASNVRYNLLNLLVYELLTARRMK